MTEKDPILEDLFSSFNPDLGSDNAFMAKLNRKLNAVEYIRKVQDKQIRTYRIVVLVSLLIGVVLGGAAAAFIMTHPFDEPLFRLGTDSVTLTFLTQHSRLITTALISILTCAGVFAFISLAYDYIIYIRCKAIA